MGPNRWDGIATAVSLGIGTIAGPFRQAEMKPECRNSIPRKPVTSERTRMPRLSACADKPCDPPVAEKLVVSSQLKFLWV